MLTKQISEVEFICAKQDGLALAGSAIIQVVAVNSIPVAEAYAIRCQDTCLTEFAQYNVYYKRQEKYFLTVAYLSLPMGLFEQGNPPPDANRFYLATVVGKYPDTTESMLCFTARKQRLSILRHHPAITKAMRLTAASIAGVKMVHIYPAGLVIYERDVTLVCHQACKYVFTGGIELVESDDLATVEIAVFAYLLKNELTY